MPNLALLDPSMADHTGANSLNLGDLIIYDSVKSVIEEIFPNWQLLRFATHSPYRNQDCAVINQSDLVVLGGTNALYSYRGGHSWYLPHDGWFHLFPKIRNNILLGVGWGTGYPDRPSYRMTIFYHRILSKRWKHSVRDEFTKRNLARIGIRNVLNTGCPTTWKLNGVKTARTRLEARNCLFTLTDYAKEPILDNRLIELLLETTTGRLVYFPQGDEDINYIRILAAYDRNKARIEILDRSIPTLKQFLVANHDFYYVGTRLHCGIFCLQHKWDALIIEIDNRAAEMARDCNLPVVPRNNLDAVKNWISGQLDFGSITLPLDQIQQWKAQFRKITGR